MSDVETHLKDSARALGFDAVSIASARDGWAAGARLAEFLSQGHQGDMTWLKETFDRRQHPTEMWPEARSAVVVGLNYGPAFDPRIGLKRKSAGLISVYAHNADYHDVLKRRLKSLAREFALATGNDVKVFVDTAPLMEKPLAERAGLGWQGKHTNLVSLEWGSWLFLGVMLTSADLKPDDPSKGHCGSCAACLNICPTKAFPRPYELDARRCISYLTIEHRGPIPREFRKAMENRIYGCDDCLAVCPWNKFARTAREIGFHPRPELVSPLLRDLAGLSDPDFRDVFAGSPIKRIGRDRFVRNVMIAIGNSNDADLVEVCVRRLDDSAEIVRGAAVWALGVLSPLAFEYERLQRRHAETVSDVCEEWDAGPDA
jgi:epoxyqueuosine reductase